MQIKGLLPLDTGSRDGQAAVGPTIHLGLFALQQDRDGAPQSS